LKKALWSIALGIIVYTAMVFLSDLGKVRSALSGLQPSYIPLMLLLPLANYFFRFLKWDYFLQRVGIRLRPGRSAAVFVSGFSMTVSPGKFGELIKSCLLRDREGIPVSRSSPVVVAERLTDLMSMVLIACVGMALTGGGRALPAVAAGVLFLAICVAGIRSGRFFEKLLGLACRFGPFARRKEGICCFRSSCACLLDARSLLVSIPLGIISWGIEAMVLVAAALSLGMKLDAGTALLAHSAGTIAGAVSMIPGGLGLTELTLGGILTTRLPVAGATAVTILMRLATLWFAVCLGGVVLAFTHRASGPVPKPPWTASTGTGDPRS
jgi:uncharacterized protein (TIRG00374 family)